MNPFKIKWIKPLRGAIVNTAPPKFETNSWLEGQFQEQIESYLNDNIWVRPWLVRIHNQIQFSVFGKAHAKGVIRGKENYLFERNYISAYNGDDFIGSSKINKKVKDLNKLQEKLAALNKTLLVVLAPGKGTFYPEYFPENMPAIKTDSTNYKVYSEALQTNKINHIDFNKWFVEMKDTSSYMLYPKYGIHWSYYGMLLAADSLIKHIESDRNINLPKLQLKSFNTSSKLKHSDYDIANGMNLLFQMKSEPMCYPEYEIINTKNKKPKTIVISDSFYWSMFNIGMGKNIFSFGGFWYYNKQIYPKTINSKSLVKEVNIKQQILDNEVIILMSTDANLPKFDWGFVEMANNAFNNSSFQIEETKQFKTRVYNLKNYIKTNEKWMKKIKTKAIDRNISLDSMIHLDAIWLAKQELKQKN